MVNELSFFILFHSIHFILFEGDMYPIFWNVHTISDNHEKNTICIDHSPAP